MALSGEQRFARSSAVGRYWLARCEGFRARSGSREVGTIEHVRCTSSWQGDAYSLVIRGHGRRVSVPVDRVVEVDPWTETVVLAPSQRLRKQLSRSAATVERASVAVSRIARATAGGAKRYAPLLVEGSRRATTWSKPRVRAVASAARGWAGRMLAALGALGVLVATAVADGVAWLRPRIQSAVNRAVNRATSARRPVKSSQR